MSKPYKEKKIGNNIFVREFKEDTPDFEFIWHMDREDRIIEPILPTDWKIQIDNQLPVVIEGKVYIPKNTYHRIIKGTGNLTINLSKII
jgi:hypothetical protein